MATLNYGPLNEKVPRYMVKSIYLTSFDFDTFKSVIFKKKIMNAFIDELIKKKNYTFDFEN